ncbi:hypothetical protein PV328_012012 [Microctonus aethiopoides]|uniref:Uncharacterized protein n=1 Tax=Microctonus aethiopoides TaxID=144406 RepID=A0AA39KPZ0_9HYME|nr:hypothetical protein PV328_012012 [Microctonus aethiopoides]
MRNNDIIEQDEPTSTVPEVYVRPPTPTPSAINLPIITVSCPSRRSSIVSSRRDSDVSTGSRRSSASSVKFINDDGTTPTTDNIQSSVLENLKKSERDITRRNSEMITPCSSNKDVRRCSDFSHEKNRGSQFATKLRRNSDFGNRTPKRMMPLDDNPRLSKVLDVSPSGSRRNSDLGGLAAVKVTESRRNSDTSYRRNSDLSNIRPLVISRRGSDVSIKTLDKSPTHFHTDLTKMTVAEKFESDSDQLDCNEKCALMDNDKSKSKIEDSKGRKKSLSWKNVDNFKNDDDITANPDFTLHAILNHIAYVNRAKSDIPLHLPETNIATNRKSQIQGVLNVTYATAILGIILCIADISRIFGPYGLLGETIKYRNNEDKMENIEFPKPWPWFIYQTICRFLELIMGCAMASVTKQPSVSPRHQYFNNYSRNYTSSRFKQRDNPYI